MSDPSKAPPSSARLKDLLKGVSRSFYLTLSVLPAGVRRPISLAYLLARTSDTIADTEVLTPKSRISALNEFEAAVTGNSEKECRFEPFLTAQSHSKERELLHRVGESLALLHSMDETDRELIRSVLQTIISGQRLDLERFENASPKRIICLEDADETDDYTYRVAGCVGEFWTELCFRHLANQPETPPSGVMKNAVRFGKGLQLVNILRDFREDLAQGRCYLPRKRLAQAGLSPEDLLTSGADPAFATVHQEYVNQARDHLLAGWTYTTHLPWRWIRLRLACAWPVLIGLETIDLISTPGCLLDHPPRKVSRADVRRIILKTLLLYPFPSRWSRLAELR